jgi:tetratricopeptide (TPR) repeat protein
MVFRDYRIALGLTLLASLIAYLYTVCPTVYAGDSGDLITASYVSGNAHPTGYPLYLVLGRLFSLLPLGGVAFRYNLMSVFFGVFSAGLAFLIVRLLTKSDVAGVGGGLLVALSKAIWDQATVAEVYMMHGFFTVLCVYAVLMWRKSKSVWWMRCFLLSFGLSLTNHVSMVVYAPAYAYLILSGNEKRLRKYDWGRLLPYGVTPLLLYLYVPLAALGNPAYNWGKPDTLGRFTQHVGASMHRSNYFFTLTFSQLTGRLMELIGFCASQFHVAGLLVPFGIYHRGGRERVFLGFTGLLLGLDFFYALFLNDVSISITPFLMPSIMVFGLWGGVGLDVVFKRLRMAKGPAYQFVCVALVVAVLAGANLHESDKSGNYLAYDYGMNMLRTVEDDAIIFAHDDNSAFPLYYLTLVEGVKPGVTVIEATGQISHDFYGEDYMWMGVYPREHEKRRVARELEALRLGRPVYYTHKPDYELEGYEIIQAGLLYRVLSGREHYNPGDFWDKYEYRQVWNASIHLDEMSSNIRARYYLRLAEDFLRVDRPMAAQVLSELAEFMPDNPLTYYDLGNIWLGEREYGRAASEFEKAIRLDPENPKAHNNMGYAKAMMGLEDEAAAHYLRALRLDPYYVSARFNLAGFLLMRGQRDEAKKHYETVVALNPDYAKAYLNMGLIDYHNGEYENAINNWEIYLRLTPDDPMAEGVRETIAELRGGE